MTQEDEGVDAPLITQHPDEEDLLENQVSAGWFVWALTFSAGISGLLFGYDTGVISSTLVSIGSDLDHHPLTSLDKSLITACTSLFALFASPTTGVLADKLGRKYVIIIADVLFIIGALCQAMSLGVWGMIVGRSIIGLAVGGASLVVPLLVDSTSMLISTKAHERNRYISELSPSHLRGRLVTISSLFITGGQVVAYVIGWIFTHKANGWRWMVGLGAAPAFGQLLTLIILPETPRWLAKVSRGEEARRVLKKIYGTGHGVDRVVDQVLRSIEREVIEEEDAVNKRNGSAPTKKPSFFSGFQDRCADLFNVPGNRRALTIACMLQGLQQLCGFNCLMYFSATIFALVGFTSPTLTSLSIAITNFLFTVAAFILIDRIGRRRILLLSIPIMTTGLVLCAVAFHFLHLPTTADFQAPRETTPDGTTQSSSHIWSILILISMIIYVASYALGLGNVPWQQSELFPLSVRSVGSSLATATNWGSNFVVGLTFLLMMDHLTPFWTFICYALVCVVGLVAVYHIYPETNGLSLEEVGGLLANGWGVEESIRRGRRGIGSS
ncbi:MAG: hypothetical protein M1834_001929 [Cirrosporium novae-zelandiae]|nr:MAG: hypothetical protein M1834_001929 [Cirrosporium novae-zelandiae]